jgi:N6-L-threonylcarbamoyladenine synthase
LKDKYNFSFSGLKTAVLRYIQKEYPSGEIPEQGRNDISASFQKTVIKSLIKNMDAALKNFDVKSVSVAGGVAANKPLREAAEELSANTKRNW